MNHPLDEHEALILGSWVIKEDRKFNPDPRYVIPWSIHFEGMTPGDARRKLRGHGYYLSYNDILYTIGRLK